MRNAFIGFMLTATPCFAQPADPDRSGADRAPDANANASATTGDQAARTFPPLPQVSLGQPANAAGVPGLRDVAERARETAIEADLAGDQMVRARLLLSAANLTLAYELAPACSREFLTLSANTGENTDQATAREALDRASRWIDQAREVLDAVTSLDTVERLAEGESEERDASVATDVGTLLNAAAALEAFAAALDAYLTPTTAAEAYGKARQAASALAPVLEDDNEHIATAARFWQSALRGREDDPAPALSRLDPVSAELDRTALPYAFFGRLLRCQLIARHQNVSASLALLLQLEERSHEWWTDEDRREEALRAVALVRLQMLREWHDGFDASQQADERAWCIDRAGRLVKQYFGSDNETVMPLSPTMPLVVEPPRVEPPPESASPPSVKG